MSGERPDPEPDEEARERGERIRDGRDRRSSRRRTRTSQTDQTAQTEQTDQMEETSGGVDPSEVPLKDRNHDTYYLLEDLADELDFRLDEVNLDLQREYGADAKLEKNRHWRPLVLALGLDALEDMDAEDVREFLDDHDLLDDAPRE